MNRTTQTQRSSDNQVFNRRRRGLAHRLAIAALGAAGIALSAPMPTAFGASPCDEYRPACDSQMCECGRCGCNDPMKQTPIYRTLDTLAGGIEKVLGLDRCGSQHCDSSSCDSLGCDAATLEMQMLEPMMPPSSSAAPIHDATPQRRSPQRPSRTLPAPSTAAPSTALPRHTAPTLPVAPPMEPKTTAPTLPPPRSPQPRIVTPEATPVKPQNQPAPIEFKPIEPQSTTPDLNSNDLRPGDSPGEPALQFPPVSPDPTPNLPTEPLPTEPLPTEPMQTPAESEQTTPKSEGSIFDQLDNLNEEDIDDPFKEDAIRLESIYGGVRRSNVRQTATRIPPYRPLYQNRNAQPIPLPPAPSMRNAAPIGSGLRPAQHIAPLRPVSHEAPAALAPMSQQRVLAPYRRSR